MLVLDEIRNSILNFDEEKTIEYSKKALEIGIDPLEVIEGGIMKALHVIGEKFDKGELFIIHLVRAGEAAKKALENVLKPELLKRKVERKSIGRVVIGTIYGDIHDIGKNIVATMLYIAGFEVFDLGKDVPIEEFIKKAKEVKADIVAASALLSTTMFRQRDLILALKEAGIRDKVKVMVGGAPVTKAWAEEIGADGYGADAVEAVEVAKGLVGRGE